MALFVHIQLSVQLCKPCGLLRQFFLLWEGLFHLNLCRRLLLMQGGQLVLCGGDALQEVVQGVIQTDDVAQWVGAQGYRVLPLPFQKCLILTAVGVETQGQFKAPVAADHFFLSIGQFGAGKDQTLTGSLFLIVSNALDDHAAELLLALRVGGGKLCIGFQPGDVGVRFLNVCRELG